MNRPVIFALFLSSLFLSDITTAQEPDGSKFVASVEKAMIQAVAKAEKSVVAIARVKKDQSGDVFTMEHKPDPFGRSITLPVAPKPTDPDFIPNEYATGVVVDAKGLILTAYRVLADESDYYITTKDRKTYKATPKAADPRSDLAVLSVDAADLSPISFGDGAKLTKGQIVVALGNPYGIAKDGQPSAAWGIVSNLGRKAVALPTEDDPLGKRTLAHYGTLIETDARLERGTSGGPLLNLQGEMVGLTISRNEKPAAEASRGYAIPVDALFRRTLELLKQGKEVEYGLLGVKPSNLTPDEILQGTSGVRVSQAVANSPAARSGVIADDIIIAVDGKPIFDADSFFLQVGKHPNHALLRLDLLRGDEKRFAQVTLTKYPVRGKKIVTDAPTPWRGIRVDYPTGWIDSSGRSPLGMVFPDNGVVVSEVAENSPADRAGLRPGMILLKINDRTLAEPDEFYKYAAELKGDVPAAVLFNGQTVSFKVKED